VYQIFVSFHLYGTRYQQKLSSARFSLTKFATNNILYNDFGRLFDIPLPYSTQVKLPRTQPLLWHKMAPQTSIPLAANILGTIGTVCWCVQLVPQIWRNYRTKSTEGLPESMMLLWSISGVPFGVYAIAQQFNIPLIVQPQCFCVLCGVGWAQCLIYSR
jgi:uncharacterized protein with PQ loop repeat